MFKVPVFDWSGRCVQFFAGSLFLFLPVATTFSALAQVPVAPSIERSEIEIVRGADIVQPQTLVYKQVRDGEDPALAREDTIGVVRVPLASELDAILYPDRMLGYAVNVQHAMIVAEGQVIDVRVGHTGTGRSTQSTGQDELFLLRPPAADVFDIAVPDGLECKRLVPNTEEDRRTRGRLYGNTPCKQVPGVETVVDIAAWYDVSMTNSISGVRARPGPAHTARELRGWLRSLAPGGEQVRFTIVVTPPPAQIALAPTPIRLDTVILSSDFTFEGNVRVESVPTSGFEWITTVGVLQGPNWSGLPGRADGATYRASRWKGDVSTTLRWRATEEQRYDLTLFGSTQPTLSGDAAGSHHDVPYGLRLGARFGERDAIGVDLRMEGSFEDDPFQRNTLAHADQRIRLLVGLDRGALPNGQTHWRLSIGPTYFVDRPNIWERRADTRQLGYSVNGAFSHLLRFKKIATLLDVVAQTSQSWGYISDAGNSNIDLNGRLSLKPQFQLASTYFAIGPVVHLSHTLSDYADVDGFAESNVQYGLEMRSAILF